MTQEDKELLLKDLFARLPHGIMCQTDEHGKNYKLKGINKHKGIWWYEFDGFRTIKLPKPYLRPMSSMTNEEKKELSDITGGKFTYVYGILSNSYQNKDDGEWHNKCFRYVTLESIILVIDWLNKYNFDYRGLIEKGLAIEAPK